MAEVMSNLVLSICYLFVGCSLFYIVGFIFIPIGILLFLMHNDI